MKMYLKKLFLRVYNPRIYLKIIYMILLEKCTQVGTKVFWNFYKFHKPEFSFKIQLPKDVQLWGLLCFTSQMYKTWIKIYTL